MTVLEGKHSYVGRMVKIAKDWQKGEKKIKRIASLSSIKNARERGSERRRGDEARSVTKRGRLHEVKCGDDFI